jgi:hypothetical protein
VVNYGGGLKIRRLDGPIGINFDIRGYTLPGTGGTKVSKNGYWDGAGNYFNTYDTRRLNFDQTTVGLVVSW